MIDHDRILKLADEALTLKPPAITDEVTMNSAGGLHDFYSQADYSWPNPNTTNGLPYINRDGETYPNVFTYHRMAMRQMKDAVAALAAPMRSRVMTNMFRRLSNCSRSSSSTNRRG